MTSRKQCNPQIEIRSARGHADARTEIFDLHDGQTTLGARAPADILLPLDPGAESRLLLVAPQADGCWVSVSKHARTEVRFQGTPFEKGIVPWGMPLGVGHHVELRFLKTERTFQRARRFAVHPAIALLIVVVLSLQGWRLARRLTQHHAPESSRNSAPTPSVLFDPPRRCNRTGATALHRAGELAQLARAKSERYPFASQDGVDAVRLYHEAEDCYRSAGNDGTAQMLERQRRNLERTMTDTYTWHRINLERALEEEKPQVAALQARALLQLLQHRSDEYVRWLHEVERRMALEVEQ
jgi:hypothetical protein